jgi:hypothetical protein
MLVAMAWFFLKEIVFEDWVWPLLKRRPWIWVALGIIAFLILIWLLWGYRPAGDGG